MCKGCSRGSGTCFDGLEGTSKLLVSASLWVRGRAASGKGHVKLLRRQRQGCDYYAFRAGRAAALGPSRRHARSAAVANRWRARATLAAAFALAAAAADGAAGVCVRRSQRRAVRHTFTHTHSQARLTRRAEMRAILALAQVLVAAAAAARSAERDAAPSTALMMVSVCAPHLVPCPASHEMPPLAARVRPLQADVAAGPSVAASSTALVAVGSAAAASEVSATLVGPPLPHRPAHRPSKAQHSPHPRTHSPPMT